MEGEIAPEFMIDQGLAYPASANYYGYYCTGIESPSPWDDQHNFFGLDGQDIHYSGLQSESLPYVYYTPSYGYAQSPYDPYNPYMPGAVIGIDSPVIGTQQYLTSSTYQQSASSPSYVPIVAQPSPDVVPNGSPDPLLLTTVASVASNPETEGAKCASLLAPAATAALSKKFVSLNPISEPFLPSSRQIQASQATATLPEGSLTNVPPRQKSLSPGAMPFGSYLPAAQSQVRNSLGSVQATDYFSQGRVTPVENSLKVNVPANNGFTNYGSNIRRWPTVDKFRPRFQTNGFLNNSNSSPYVLGEQNRGPRINRVRSQWTSIAVKAYTTRVGVSGDIIINADQYNRDDFSVEYPDAKFFVIKSYSEDDVHKSIKYNVWSSTPNGNKRLDGAYEDAQKMSMGKAKKCPVFLFFSVNGSGQFCGVAEMIGPVDFNKDMDFWQQDKWTGCFPVKWHIIKDVANTSIRHILLENNENKPVTHSRDTQEITYVPGMNMLKTFKHSALKTSILDDFLYFEERERVCQEEKLRLLRTYGSPLFVPALIPSNVPNSTISQPLTDGTRPDSVGRQPIDTERSKTGVNVPVWQPRKVDYEQPNCAVIQPVEVDDKQPTGVVRHPLKADGGQPNGATSQPVAKQGEKSDCLVDHTPKADGRQPNGVMNQLPSADGRKLHAVIPTSKADENQFKNGVDSPPKAVGKQLNYMVRPSKSDLKKLNGTIDLPLSGDVKLTNHAVHSPKIGQQLNGSVTQPPRADGKQADVSVHQHLKGDPKQSDGIANDSQKTESSIKNTDDHKISVKAALTTDQVTSKLDATKPLGSKKDAKPDLLASVESIMRIGSLSIDPKISEVNRASAATDVVTVGSVHIQVKNLGESSSGSLRVGTVLPDADGSKLRQKA